MRKLFPSLILIIIISVSLLTLILSTKGIKTNKFNEIISNKINDTNSNLRLEIMDIKFKKRRNFTAKTLTSRKFSQKVIKPKKGKGSFKRIKK